MENRKSLIFGVILLLAIFSVNKVYAYGADVHAYLTDEVIDFYNSNYSNNPIKNEWKNYLIDGSRREDDVPRWLNHFYDPVNNQGLNDPEWGKGFSSKEWAQSDSKQTTYAYKPIKYIASILSSTEQKAISGMDLNFTWQQAIRYYRDGKTEKAMFALGHILHLIEDASVPDHTRNDGHPDPLGDGSPYEVFSERFSITSPDGNLVSRLADKKPFDSMPTLSSYFNEMAKYSNNNFYSVDTLSSDIYSDPDADYSKIEGKYNYEFRSDSELGDHKLAIIVSDPLYLVNKRILTIKGENDKVMNDYWSHLSTKSVQVGAGVLKLFFDDIERVNYGDSALVKDDRNPITKLVDNARAWAQIAFSSGKALTSSTSNVAREAWSNTFSNGGSDEELVEVIDTKKVNDVKGTEGAGSFNINLPEDDNLFADEGEEVDKKVESLVEEKDDVLIDIKQPKETVVKYCTFGTSQSSFHKNIIFNEVAWMGGDSVLGLSSNDEWIELKNISTVPMNISGWQILDQGEQIKIKLANNTTIPAGGFYLLERTDDNSVPGVSADLLYSGALSNTNEGLRLFDDKCNLIDEVLANPDWPAGDNTQKRTMERSSNLSWHTYNGTAHNSIFGTPKKENSAPAVVYSGSGSGSAPVNNQQPTTNDQQQTSVAKILISEVQITGGTGKTENDFIELYNPNNFQVNLNGHRLVKRTKTGTNDTGIKSWTSDAYIPANGYYLWANSGYTDIPATPDITTTATISNDNGVAIRFGAVDTGTVIDSVAWGGAENIFIESSVFPINPGANQSIQRKFQNNTFIDTDNNANDFEIQTCPSPKAPSRDCQIVSQTPSVLLPLEIIEVVYDYNTKESDEGKELVRVNNPNAEEVDVSGYSLQYLGSDGDFTKIKRKYFEAGNKIPAQGIFKIGMNCSGKTPCENVDMSWSQELNNSTGTVFLVSNKEFLVGLSDPDIVDGFHYPEVTQLAEPNNFIVDYNPDKLEINLSWEGNPSLVYQIQEYNSPGVTIFEGKGKSFTKRIDEVGKNYKFSVRAFNENAEYTELIEKEITIPTFIKDVHFYNSTHYTYNGESQDNLVEFSYDSYPFLPLDLVYAPWGNPDVGPNYKLLVFYLNREAPKRTYLNGTSPLDEDRNNVLMVEYETCAGGGNSYASLLLPDITEKCNLGGGNSSMNYYSYLKEGDRHLLLPVNSFVDQSTFTESDYFTVAFYGFQRDFPQGTAPINGIYPNFKLLAVDKTKYYFNNPPNHELPQLTGEITLNLDKQNSRLNVSWPGATDADTLDNLLTYEIKYASLDDWQLTKAVNSATDTTRIVSAGDHFAISVRAKDNLGNYSTPDLTAEWSYPATDFSFIQSENNTWSSSFGLGYGYYGSDGNGVNLQSITPITDFQFDKVSLRVKQMPVANDTVPNDHADLKLSVYPDNNSQPDFGSVIASSIISNIYNPDSNSDITFHFDSPVSFSASSKYWLTLEVESYADGRGFWRNAWQNAASDTNPYSQGEAARIKVKVTDGAYSYNDFTIELDNDWYMKIGLE